MTRRRIEESEDILVSDRGLVVMCMRKQNPKATLFCRPAPDKVLSQLLIVHLFLYWAGPQRRFGTLLNEGSIHETAFAQCFARCRWCLPSWTTVRISLDPSLRPILKC